MRDWSSWETFGLRGPKPEVDLAATLANAQRVARYAHEHKRMSEHIRAMGVDLVEHAGNVRFVDPNTLAAEDGQVWAADRVIIAAGGRASRPPIPGADLALTYEDIRTLAALPERVCVIGAADTGCQLTSILADFGCSVWLLEHAPRILPRADQDVSTELEHAFRARGIIAVTGASVTQLEPRGHELGVVYRIGDQTRTVDVDAVFFAAGWPGNGDLIDATTAGVALDRGYIVVDDYLRTTTAHIYAAGDVNGHSMLVASARLEGRIAAENAVLGPLRRVEHTIVPTGSFTDPEYASVGLTEEQARARFDCVVAVARYDDLLRPVADGRPDGFCKLIVDTDQRLIVGAHVLGEYSAEVIQTVAACMAGGMRIEQVADLQLAFPTFTEGIGMAAQMLVRELGNGPIPQVWSSLSAPQP